MTKTWSKVWPRKEGFYWFYGWDFGRAPCGTERAPKHYLVEVMKISNGFLYVTQGHFFSKEEGADGYFMGPVTFPDPPKEI